jgi:hypothetical protein
MMSVTQIQVGDFVDALRGPKQSKFHGIVTKIDGSNISVMWLKSSETRDVNIINGTYSISYCRGYTTVQRKSALVFCDASDPTIYHPKSNPWGRKFGVSD